MPLLKRLYFESIAIAKCACENGNYLGSIIGNSVICDRVIKMTKVILTKASPTKSILAIFKKKCDL